MNGPLYCGYGSANTRLLVRICIDLLLSGGNARHTAGESRRRDRPLAAVRARSDFQSARLGDLTVQYLSGERPLHVARPGADLRRAEAAVRAAGAVSAEFLAGGARRVTRTGGTLGRELLPRRLSCRIRRKPQGRGGRDDRRGAEEFGQDAGAVLERAQSEEIKSQLRAQTEEAQRLGIFGAPSFVTADGELFGATTGSKRRWTGLPARPHAARASGPRCDQQSANMRVRQ